MYQYRLTAYDYAHNKYHTEYTAFDRGEAWIAARKMADRLGISVAVCKPFMGGYVIDQTFGDWGHIKPRIPAHNKQSRFNPKLNVSE